VLSAPPQTLTPDSGGTVWLACLNNSTNAAPHSFSASLPGTLTAGDKSFPLTLRLAERDDSEATIAPGGFVRRQYDFVLPAGVSGRVLLEADGLNPVVLQVAGQSLPVATPADESAPAAPERFFTPGFSEFIGNHISPYEPIFFLLGTYPAAEFQFSLKYKLVNLDSAWNPLGHIYFAYTQTSFWDLFNQDPSFYDTSYKPSAFLYYPKVIRGGRFQLDLQGGVEHESNGRGGSMERALNTAYLQPTLRVALPAQLEFDVQPRGWFYLSRHLNNADLPDYRGYADVRCSLCRWTEKDDGRHVKQFELGARLRLGDRGDHAGWLFDARYNLPVSWKINPAIEIQYFTGYGQTLRQYNQPSTGLRGGFCLWY
jgi:outer membrane phospholipase A